MIPKNEFDQGRAFFVRITNPFFNSLSGWLFYAKQSGKANIIITAHTERRP